VTAVRPVELGDIPAIVRLFERVFPNHGWTSRSACEAYFREVFFESPCRDDSLPSWLAEDAGQAVGFCGILPRRMEFRGQSISVAVGTTFMVDPDRRNSLAAMRLLTAYLSGPQDLTFADGATDQARNLWIRAGGHAPLGYNLHWLRPLRPARQILAMLGARGAIPRVLRYGLQPFAAAVDLLAARLPPNKMLRDSEDLSTAAALEPADVVAEFRSMVHGKALVPVYEQSVVEWLFEHAVSRAAHGSFRARRVVAQGRGICGWYVYYVRRGSVGEVVQLCARPGAYDTVLAHLLADAWRQGATAVRGRLDPDRALELADRHCWLRWDGPATLVHSRHPEIVDAILRGDAFFSRFEGEWWLRFLRP